MPKCRAYAPPATSKQITRSYNGLTAVVRGRQVVAQRGGAATQQGFTTEAQRSRSTDADNKCASANSGAVIPTSGLISNLLPGEKVLRYEADERSLGFQPAPQNVCQKTRNYGIAAQRHAQFAFLCGFLLLRITNYVSAHRVNRRGGGLRCAHLRATPLAGC
jgi:hypothetical protein